MGAKRQVMMGAFWAGLLLAFESLATAWVLIDHVPGLWSNPLALPVWQRVGAAAALGLAALPIAMAAARRGRGLPGRWFVVLAGGVGAALWMACLGLSPREVPPPTWVRIPVAIALFVPWMVLPAIWGGLRKSPRSRRRVFGWWLGVGSLAICELTIGEAVREREWRIMRVESERYALVVNDARGYRIAPYARWQHVYSSNPDDYFEPGNVVRYAANAEGIRERGLSKQRPDGVLRVLALGDSFTLGEGVHEEDTWPRQLERVLQDRMSDSRIEVINCGVNAYDTAQELAQYRLGMRDYDPDVVVAAMVWNDAKPGDPRGFGASYVLSTATLAQYLPLCDRSCRAIGLLFGFDGIADTKGEWEGSLTSLRALAQEVRDDGAEFVAAIYPSVRHLDNHALRAVYGIQGSFCQENNIRMFNGYPVFRDAPRRRWHVHEVDNHPNAAAHKRFATHLADIVEPLLRGRANDE